MSASGFDLNIFRRRLKKRGQPAMALVRSYELSKLKDATSSFNTYHYVIEVRPEGEAPFEAKVTDAFTVLERPKPGDLVKVRFYPKSHKVAFDLDGDPRYDASVRPKDVWTDDEPRSAAPAGWPAAVVFAAPAASSPADEGDELLNRLERLGQLRESGVLTQNEFDAQKARLLGER